MSGVQLSDGYCAPEDWDTLTRDEREYVMGLREERDRRRHVGAISGSTTGNSTSNETQRDRGALVETPPGILRGIGSTMTRRDLGGRGDPNR